MMAKNLEMLLKPCSHLVHLVYFCIVLAMAEYIQPFEESNNSSEDEQCAVDDSSSVDDNILVSQSMLIKDDFVGLNLDKLNPCPNIGSAGFIVLDLETDGLIIKKGGTVSVPSITQVAFGPLEMVANKAYVTNFYIENDNFPAKLAKSKFLQTSYKGYDAQEKYYIFKHRKRRRAVTFDRALEYLIKWKIKLYGKCKPVFLIAHNAEGFDKIVFEYKLKQIELLEIFRVAMNLIGWIDSLPLIRNLPSVGHVLKFPDDTVPHAKEKPFSLSSLVRHLELKKYNGEPFILHFAENDVEALIKIMRDFGLHNYLSRTIII